MLYIIYFFFIVSASTVVTMEYNNASDRNCLPINWYTFGREIVNIDNKISFLTINLRSIKYKFSELLGRLASLTFNFTFIVITETWLTADNDKGFNIPGYKSYSVYRSGVRGGGVKIYYREFLDVSIHNNMTGIHQSYEGIFLTVNIRRFGTLIVGGIYRPPSSSIDLFMNALRDFLSDNHFRCVLAGDFNINLLSETSDNFTNMMYEFSFDCSVNAATYFSPIALNETSCLDHVWHNLTFKSQTFIISPPIADHLSVASFFYFNVTEFTQKIKFRCFNNRNIDNFLSNFVNEVMRLGGFSVDVHLFGRELMTWLTGLTNKYFPIKTKIMTAKRTKAPWITPRIMRCINKKHYWLKLLKRKIIYYSFFKSYCRALNKLLVTAERRYHQRKFDQTSRN